MSDDLRALDKSLAEAMGWKAEFDESFRAWVLREPDGTFRAVDGESAEITWRACPCYSTDPVAAEGLKQTLRDRDIPYWCEYLPDTKRHMMTVGEWSFVEEIEYVALARAALRAIRAREETSNV